MSAYTQVDTHTMAHILRRKANKGNPLAAENIRRASRETAMSVRKGHTHSGGQLSTNHTTQWKPVSEKTMAELAAMGKLSPQDVQHAIHKGRLTPGTFKKVFWENIDVSRPSKEQLNLINCFAEYLF